MKTEEFRILLALEPSWSISINGREFLHLRSSEIDLEGEFIRFGGMHRRIVDLEIEGQPPDLKISRVAAGTHSL